MLGSDRQYEILRAEVVKRGADPSNITVEIKRLAELIKKGGVKNGRNLLDLQKRQGYPRRSGQSA